MLSSLQYASASYQFTVSTGQSAQPGLICDGLFPISADHSPWVTSVVFIENDPVSVTACCVSSSARHGSDVGDPIVNVPGAIITSSHSGPTRPLSQYHPET